MKSIAILHEDTGHKNLIIELIQYLNDTENLKLDIELIDFSEMGSKNNFFKPESPAYKNLENRVKAKQIKKVLFVVDADYCKDNPARNGLENTKNELHKIIIEPLNLQNVTDIYVVRTPLQDEGYLESLLLATLPEEKRRCIESFVSCSQINAKSFYKTIIYSLHKIAYPVDSYYNFQDDNFDELKTKLINLFK